MQISTLAALITLVEGIDPFLNKAKPYSQEFEDNYSILKHTGWEGPWSQRRGVGLNRDAPAGCRVDQVAMIHRHGERYPSAGNARQQAYTYGNLTEGKIGHFKGSLEFLNHWQPYADGETPMDQQETLYGPYSGVLGAYWNGVDYRRRYGHLYDGESIVPFFASGFERIATTARKFGEGFLGFNYTDLAAVQIIPETADQGANTLVTGDCPSAISKTTRCPVPDEKFQKTFQNGWILPEFKQAARRLNKENGLNLTGSDVHNLMSTAAFELNIRGNSPWIEVFTDEEWIAFEYYESAFYYCYFGPGAEATPYRGSLYLNATRTLFNQGPEQVGSMFWSFVHDTDITPVVALLGFASPDNFDPREVQFHSLWDLTDIVPQSGRLVLERLVCEDVADLDSDEYLASQYTSKFPLAFNSSANDTAATYASNYTYPVASNVTVDPIFGNLTSNETYSERVTAQHKTGKENIYIRVVMNEAVAPLPACNSGPGKSCKLSSFNKLVDEAIEGKDYYENCVAPENEEWPSHIDFFWNWNVTNAYDSTPNNIPYQAGLIDYQGEAFGNSPY